MRKETVFGLVKNASKVTQSWGPYEIAPGTIGRLPIEVVEGLSKYPSRELLVVDDHPDLCPFVRTTHFPDSPRYRG